MARLVVAFVVVLSVIVQIQGRHEQYEGHQLFRVQGPKPLISALDETLDVIWSRPDSRSPSGDLVAVVKLSPEERRVWLQKFEQTGIVYANIVEDLAEVFRAEEAEIQSRRAIRSGRSMTWDTYYRHQEINDYLDELASRYPEVVTVVDAGLSYEGRQIKYVRISSSRFEETKPVIVIDAAVHAREWVAPPVALYLINQLVVDVVDSRLTEEIDWVIIPLANPDGYEYSMDEDRMWRKTRSRSHAGADACPGVDGNRNFDHEWGTRPDSAVPCSIIYEGPAPFSEPEIRIIMDVVLEHLDRTAMYISLHSFGNMFLYAWGNNGTLPSNALHIHLAGTRMANAIETLALPQADRYIVGNAAQVLYYTTGTSRDWTRAVGVPLTYTLELPGYDYGFLVPLDYIEQIVKETWAGISEGARYVIGL